MPARVDDPKGRVPIFQQRVVLPILGGVLGNGMSENPSPASYAQQGYSCWSKNPKQFVWAQFGNFSNKAAGNTNGADYLNNSYFVFEFASEQPGALIGGKNAASTYVYNIVTWHPGVRPGF
jgi:hypothetical protein